MIFENACEVCHGWGSVKRLWNGPVPFGGYVYDKLIVETCPKCGGTGKKEKSMLRVQLSLNSKSLVGEVHIQNDGTGNQSIGHYDVKFFKCFNSMHDKPDLTARVERYPRDLGAWHLVENALLCLRCNDDEGLMVGRDNER